jgi:hypothetical protein
MAETREVVQQMRTALLAAAKQFSFYADYHWAKKPPDREKAEANYALAMQCREAIQASEHVLRLPITNA